MSEESYDERVSHIRLSLDRYGTRYLRDIWVANNRQEWRMKPSKRSG